MKPQTSIATRKLYTILAALALVISGIIVPISLFLLVNEGSEKLSFHRSGVRKKQVAKKVAVRRASPLLTIGLRGVSFDGGTWTNAQADFPEFSLDGGSPMGSAWTQIGNPSITPPPAPVPIPAVPKRRKVSRKKPTSRPIPAQIKKKVANNQKEIQKKLEQAVRLEKEVRQIKERVEMFAKRSIQPKYYRYRVRVCKRSGKRLYCRWRLVRIRRARRQGDRKHGQQK